MHCFARIFANALILAAVLMPALTAALPAHAGLWQILPGQSIATLLKEQGGDVVGSDIARLDPGTMVVVTYIQSGRTLYRCIEYVTEFQYDLLRAACFVAVVPPPAGD